MKRFFTVLLVLLLLLSGCGRTKSEDNAQNADSEEQSDALPASTEEPQTPVPLLIKIPFSAEELKGQKCSDVHKKLELLGFTKIGFVDADGKELKEPDSNSETAYVKIGGNVQFSLGDEMSADQIVIIGIKGNDQPETEPTAAPVEEKSEKIQKDGFNEKTNWVKEFGGMTISIPSYFKEGSSNSEISYTVGVSDNGTANLILFTFLENCTEESVFEVINDLVDKSLQIWDSYQIDVATDTKLQGRRARIVHATCQNDGEAPVDVYITLFVASNTFYRVFLVQSPEAKYDYLTDYASILDHIVFNEENSGTGNGSDNLIAKGTVGDSYIEVKDWQIKYDYSGKPALVLTYDWTNNSKDTTSALMAVSVKGFQKGAELDIGFLLDNSIDTGSSIRDVRPGTTITVQEVFTLYDTESEVEFEITELWDFYGSSNKIEFTIPLK